MQVGIYYGIESGIVNYEITDGNKFLGGWGRTNVPVDFLEFDQVKLDGQYYDIIASDKVGFISLEPTDLGSLEALCVEVIKHVRGATDVTFVVEGEFR